MGTSKRAPSYSLERIKSLSEEGRFTVNGRTLRWIRNHLGRFDARQIVQKVILCIAPEDFYKTEQLEVIPGKWADVYRHIMTGDPNLDDEDGWYVKVFIDDDGEVRLSVMSANWEGYIH